MPSSSGRVRRDRGAVEKASGRMIEGLRLSITGEELRRLLDERMADHGASVDRWKRELARTPAEEPADAVVVPGHICENEIDRHEWRAEVLAFIRDHVEPSEMYLVGEVDLAFAELLPQKPGWMEQSEYEERTRVGFTLERLVREVRGLTWSARALPGTREAPEPTSTA
jgi:hypothetical protein